MGDMRHRDGKLKVMHTIIGDFGKVLRQIAALDEVESVLTGTIAPSKSYKETLTFQYFTDNGLKLLAKTTTAVQEIFIVTTEPELLLDELQKSGLIEQAREDVRHNAPRRRRRQERMRHDHSPQRRHSNEATPADHAAVGKEADPLSLRQQLSAEALSALLKIKAEATTQQRVENSSAAPDRAATKTDKSNPTAKQNSTRKAPSKNDEEDFAALFAPEDDDMSFAELLNQSKLDPKFFK